MKTFLPFFCSDWGFGAIKTGLGNPALGSCLSFVSPESDFCVSLSPFTGLNGEAGVGLGWRTCDGIWREFSSWDMDSLLIVVPSILESGSEEDEM